MSMLAYEEEPLEAVGQHGGRMRDIVGLMNAVMNSENERTKVVAPRLHHSDSIWIKSASFAGINLRVRQEFSGDIMRRASITGKGWMVDVKVNRVPPRSLKQGAYIEKFQLAVHQPHYIMTTENWFVHSVSLISPDAFRNEMAVLRTFEAMWNRRG